ncbi:putative metal-binding motif-containing protein [Candidatus Uhrbacteria bacterium]|nr:putative metal-binding motif-containing protein [Candidatus Uhrbacteria bacterium]
MHHIVFLLIGTFVGCFSKSQEVEDSIQETGDTYPSCTPQDEVCDGRDNDCDGEIDNDCDVDDTNDSGDSDSDTDSGSDSDSAVETTVPVDADQDGYTADEDCDDNDPNVNPGAYEVYYNIAIPGSGLIYCQDGLDNDCDGHIDEDDSQCADEDSDRIPDGVDYLFICDVDGDGFNETVCIRADMVWADPWDNIDCIQQIDDFTTLSLADANTLETVDWGGETFEVCPVYPRTTGNQSARAVSSYGTDGASIVDTRDCSDWIPSDLSVYCLDWPDNLCTTVNTSDGCQTVGRVVSFTFDGTTVTP